MLFTCWSIYISPCYLISVVDNFFLLIFCSFSLVFIFLFLFLFIFIYFVSFYLHYQFVLQLFFNFAKFLFFSLEIYFRGTVDNQMRKLSERGVMMLYDIYSNSISYLIVVASERIILLYWNHWSLASRLWFPHLHGTKLISYYYLGILIRSHSIRI